MSIFVVGLLLGAILIGFGAAYVHQLKQQRRQPSDTGLLDRHPDVKTHLRRDVYYPRDRRPSLQRDF